MIDLQRHIADLQVTLGKHEIGRIVLDFHTHTGPHLLNQLPFILVKRKQRGGIFE